MKFLEKLVDDLEPKFSGNKFAHTVFDGFKTFLFTPKTVTSGGGVHIRDGIDLKRTMVTVVLALQLCLLWGMYNVGHQHYFALGLYKGLSDAIFTKFFYGFFQILPIIIVAHVVGLGIEFFYAARKGHGIEEGFLVTGMLIPLIMPPAIPLWMVALATAFSVIIAKEAFGGTGMNIFNVALTARVFIFFAYPTDISGDVVWVSYGYNWLHQLFGMEHQTLAALNLQALPDAFHTWKDYVWAHQVDGWTGATPLGLAAKAGWSGVLAHYSVSDMFWGAIPGSVGEMCKPAIILGAIILVITGIGSWRIMLTMILGALFMGFLLNTFGMSDFAKLPFYYHLIMGSFLFAMAFMATDPVTAAQTSTGKLIYGFMIGIIGMIVRVINPAYPEGWMLAILFMNMFAPTIDYFVYQANIKRRLARANQQ
ncbi:MAG: NADH:ubiquinone reductase (Na(+)-transporting) subunit B [Chitinophagales bacterium]|nr:NADH:ubiquinone reductase (Na(+)-transporting) subunit B [Bacteroidota bacterium]